MDPDTARFGDGNSNPWSNTRGGSVPSFPSAGPSGGVTPSQSRPSPFDPGPVGGPPVSGLGTSGAAQGRPLVRTASPPNRLALIIGVVVVLIAAGVGVVMLTGGERAPVTTAESTANGSYQNEAAGGAQAGSPDTDEEWSGPARQDVAPDPVLLPIGAVACGRSGSGAYSESARGNDVTSCPFADSVRDAVRSSGGSFPRTVSAYSPVTHKTYSMRCAGDRLVTCRGGNDAVVYVY